MLPSVAPLDMLLDRRVVFWVLAFCVFIFRQDLIFYFVVNTRNLLEYCTHQQYCQLSVLTTLSSQLVAADR